MLYEVITVPAVDLAEVDLGELLEALHPGFLRFPGGCIVEGRYLESRYQWKKTIGDPADRTLIINRWNRNNFV